jgi:K+-sensing histidine kinase KdpD
MSMERTAPGEESRPPRAGEKSSLAEGDRSGRLGFVAHEVRNPLSTALWTAELLARMSAEDRAGARGEKMSAMMLRALGRVRQLVEDHFLTERLDVGGIPLRPEALPLGVALEAAAARIPAGAGKVQVDVDAALVVRADRVLLERALDAIVASAGRDEAAVLATARGQGDRVVLRVTGATVSTEALADPVKGSPSDPRGRALGLPLARRIAAVLGGGLTAAEGGLVLELPAGEPDAG